MRIRTILIAITLLASVPGIGALANITPLSEAATEPAPALPGVTDLNDGWYHIVTPDNLVVLDDGAAFIAPDEDGFLVFHQEVWHQGAAGEEPDMLPIGHNGKFVHRSLGFASLEGATEEGAARNFLTTGHHEFGSIEGDVVSYRIPAELFLEASGGQPFSVWSHVAYVPRGGDYPHSFGAPSDIRSDHTGSDDDACRDTRGAAPDADNRNLHATCPQSGGFFSLAKNAAFDAGFQQDLWSTAEVPLGSSDGRELGYRGHVDRLEYALTGLMVLEGADAPEAPIDELPAGSPYPMVTITSPAAEVEYDGGSTLTVAWTGGLIDLSGDSILYRAELVTSDGTIVAAPLYACTTLAGQPGKGACTADIEVPTVQGPATVRVFTHAGQDIDGGLACNALGLALGACDTVDVNVDGFVDPTLRIRLVNSPTSMPANGESIQFVYQATWIGGENRGNPADGQSILLLDNGNVVATGTTDLSGIASFVLSENDAKLVIRAVIDNDEVPSFDSNDYEVIWTDIVLTRANELDQPRTTLYAKPGETYRVAYRVSFTYDAGPVEGATVTLLDNGVAHRAFTNATGLATVPLRENSPREVTYTSSAFFDPANGAARTANAVDVTITWAKVVVSGLDVENVDNTVAGWHDVDDVVTFSFQANLVYGPGVDDVRPAEGAQFTLDVGPLRDDITVGATGLVSQSHSFADPITLTPVIAFVSTVEGITDVTIDTYDEQIWAKVLITNFAVSNPDGLADGWQNVGDEVDFSFDVRLAVDDNVTIPAQGAEVTFTALTSDQATVDATGSLTFGRTSNSVVTTTPVVDFTSTPQGITATKIDAFDLQRWTEIQLTVEADDSFANVDQAVKFTFGAKWAHDDGNVDQLSVDVLANDGAVINSCAIIAGAGVCNATRDHVYSSGQTFVVTSSDTGVTRLLNDESVTLDVIWTEVVISPLVTDDDFVNVDDTVTWTGTAHYAHDPDMAVPSGTFVFNGTFDCERESGSIVGGIVTIEISCDSVKVMEGANAFEFVLSAAHDGVTRLQAPVTAEAIWTELLVTYTTDKENSILQPLEGVRFTTSVVFAHNMAPVPWAVVQVAKEGASQGPTCLTNSTGQCNLRVFENLGQETFTVRAVSTKVVDQKLQPDITRMNPLPPTATYRWTAIGFGDFRCATYMGDDVWTEASCDQTFATGTLVRVHAKAVAADDETDTLVNALVDINGAEVRTDAQGEAFVDVTDFFQGDQVVNAMGLEAEIDGHVVTWSKPKSLSIRFE